MAEIDVGTDRLFGGRLVLEQFRRGHRAGTDAVLLAAAADIRPGDLFIDVGAGTGAVGLALALREPGARGVLLEADKAAAALAARNIGSNELTDRVSAVCVDLFDRAACRSAGLAGVASLVVSNPPYYEVGAVRPSPEPSRAAAHVLGATPEGAGHGAWVERACALLRPHGRIVMIHRPDALPALLAAMGRRLGGVTVKPVHGKASGPAIRLIIGGRRDSKAPLTLLPPLVLHGSDGAFTPEASCLHMGGAMPLWPKEHRPRRAG